RRSFRPRALRTRGGRLLGIADGLGGCALGARPRGSGRRRGLLGHLPFPQAPDRPAEAGALRPRARGVRDRSPRPPRHRPGQPGHRARRARSRERHPQLRLGSRLTARRAIADNACVGVRRRKKTLNEELLEAGPRHADGEEAAARQERHKARTGLVVLFVIAGALVLPGLHWVVGFLPAWAAVVVGFLVVGHYFSIFVRSTKRRSPSAGRTLRDRKSTRLNSSHA